jgi:hypothetical protein
MLPSFLTGARRDLHAALLRGVLRVSKDGIPSNADGHSPPSVAIAQGIMGRLGTNVQGSRLAGQMAGSQFEVICARFIEATFRRLTHLRPGKWHIQRIGGRDRLEIAKYEQYSHLIALDAAAKESPELAAALGSDYTITPDIIISREPEPDSVINEREDLVDDASARLTSLRRANGGLEILHASISCKWTVRSDRAQNARSEALNLIRNRKGQLPHVAVVTGEPLPSRLASIALGTGDIDCVYHFALSELQAAVDELELPDAQEMLSIMVEGKRLRDITDLPLDLAV